MNNNSNNRQDDKNMSESDSFLFEPNENIQPEKKSTKQIAKTKGKGSDTSSDSQNGNYTNDTSKDKKADKTSRNTNKIGEEKIPKKLANNKVANMANMKGKNPANSQDSGLNSFFSKVNDRKAKQRPTSSNTKSNDNDNKDKKDDLEVEDKKGDSVTRERNSLGNIIKPSFLEENQEETQEESAGSSAIKKTGKALMGMIGAVAGVFSIPAVGVIAIIVPIIAIFSIFFTTTTTYITSFSIDFLISEKWGESINGIEVKDSDYEEDQVAFVNRIIEVASDYRDHNKVIDPHFMSAVQFVMSNYDKRITVSRMTDSIIEELAKLMFNDNGVYDESVFRSNLEHTFLPRHPGQIDSSLFPKIVDEIFEYVKAYHDTFLADNESSTAIGGSCTYDAPGVNIGGVQKRGSAIHADNIQVQLMETGTASRHDYGGTFGKKMEGEALIPFENYAAGCSYQEIGSSSPDDAIKAQIIAARGYALARPFDMGGWRKLTQENGQWILYTAGSTTDQVYCSLEEGCSSNKTTTASDACQWGMIYSGTTGHGTICQYPLPSEHKLYQIRDEMAGKVLVDSDGYIIYTNFAQTEQTSWINGARSGEDYTQMLLATYGSRGAVEVKQMACRSGSSDYHTWKQYDSAWASIPLSPSPYTMEEVGCLVTSLAMLISKSNVETTVTGTFNPGTFVQALSRVNSFDSAGNLTDYNNPTLVASNFQFERREELSGSQSEQINQIKNLLNQNYYIVSFVTNSETASHFVAIDSVSGSKVTMMDPGSESTDLFATYDPGYLLLYKKGA